MEENSKLISSLQQEVLSWPELVDLIKQISEDEFKKLSLEQRLTREQMAKLYQVHKDTIADLSEHELEKLGWRKIYVSSLPRYERIEIIEASKEALKRAKKSSK